MRGQSRAWTRQLEIRERPNRDGPPADLQPGQLKTECPFLHSPQPGRLHFDIAALLATQIEDLRGRVPRIRITRSCQDGTPGLSFPAHLDREILRKALPGHGAVRSRVQHHAPDPGVGAQVHHHPLRIEPVVRAGRERFAAPAGPGSVTIRQLRRRPSPGLQAGEHLAGPPGRQVNVRWIRGERRMGD